MFQIDPFSLLPQFVKDLLINSLVDIVSGQAKKLLGDEVAGKVKKLRSDAAFRESCDQGIARALKRFQQEYEQVDRNLVRAIMTDKMLFKSPEVQEALLKIIQSPGSSFEDEREKVIQTFSSVLPARKQRERVDQAVSYLLKCLAEELWILPEIRPIYEAQFLRRSTDELKQQTEIQAAQLEALNRMNSEIHTALLQLTQAVFDQKQLSGGGAAPALPPGQKVMHNLPGRHYGHFIERKGELGEVVRLLHPTGRHFLITVVGIGGIGKTTLALEIAHQYLHNYERIPIAERFDAIIWTSAKQTVLTAEGIQRRTQVLRVLEDIYKTIAITLQREDITRVPVEDQEALVCSALTRQRTLLIVDNLETIDDERVLSFLREIPFPTKVIVTTRHSIDAFYPIRLKEMEWEVAGRYMDQQCNYRKLELNESQKRRLHQVSGGVPLAINLSIALIAKGIDFEEVIRKLGNANNNDIAAYCFQSSVDLVRDKPAYRLMLSLALFNPDASREALGFVSDLSNYERDEGLADLVGLSLVNHSGNRFGFLPITKSYAIEELKRQPDLYLETGRRWIQYLRGLKHTDPHNEHTWRLDTSGQAFQEGPNIIEGVGWAYQYGTADDVFELTSSAMQYLDHHGLWGELELYITRAQELARSVQNELYQARFGNNISWLEEQRGNFAKARQYAEESLALYQKMDNTYGQGASLRRLSGVYRKLKDFDKAKSLLDQAQAVAEAAQNMDLLANTYSGKGKLARDMGNWDLAWEYFTKAQEWFQARAQESLAYEDLVRGTWGQMAFVACKLGRLEESKKLFDQAIGYFEERGTKGYLATLMYRLAVTEEALGEQENALAHVTEALDVFERLGMEPDYEEAKKLLDRLNSL